MHDVRRALARDGYQELVNYSFVDAAWEQDFAGNPDPIRVLNPIASQMSVMRTTLLGGLVAGLVYNLNRKQNRARLFEIGRVFLRDAEVADGPLAVQGIAQPTVVSGLAYGQTVLAKACAEAGIPFDNNEAHSAAYDAERTAELFCEIVNRWKESGGWLPDFG